MGTPSLSPLSSRLNVSSRANTATISTEQRRAPPRMYRPSINQRFFACWMRRLSLMSFISVYGGRGYHAPRASYLCNRGEEEDVSCHCEVSWGYLRSKVQELIVRGMDRFVVSIYGTQPTHDAFTGVREASIRPGAPLSTVSTRVLRWRSA